MSLVCDGNSFLPMVPNIARKVASNSRAMVGLASIAALLLSTGCAHGFKQPEVKLRGFEPNIRFNTKPTKLTLPLTSAALALFDSDDFCPVGGKRILPAKPVALASTAHTDE